MLIPLIVLAVTLSVLAGVRVGRDPEWAQAELAREAAQTKAANQRDLSRARRGRRSGWAMVGAVIRVAGRLARRHVYLVATVVGFVVSLVLTSALPPVASAAAVAVGWFAGRALPARRGIRKDGIAPRVVEHRQSLALLVEALVAGRFPSSEHVAPRARLWVRATLAAAAVTVPLVAYLPGGVFDAVAAAATACTLVAVFALSVRAHRARLRADHANELAEQATREQIAALAGAGRRAHEVIGKIDPRSALIQVTIPSDSFAKLRSNLDAALVSVGLDRWEGGLQSVPSTVHGGSDLWLSLVPATPETLRRRELMASSDGLVIGTKAHGRRTELTLTHGTSPARADQVDAWARRELRADLVEWAPLEDRAFVEVLTPKAREVRTRLAELTRLEPHRLNVRIEEGLDHIEKILIPGAPVLDRDPAKRREIWLMTALSLPDGSNGWTVREDAAKGDITLTWGPPRSLPSVVPGRSLLPSHIDGKQWHRLPFGLTERGTPACIDLKAGPHTLVVGGTGSGKTYATRMLLLAAYSRGFEVIVIDPSKRFAGLRDMDPYAKVVATGSKAQAASVLEAVYREVGRRVDLAEQHGVEDWRGLPRALGVRPWFVVVDEYAGLIAPKLQKPSNKQSDAYAEWEEEDAAIDTIKGRMSNLAAEARSAGIHLCVVTQSAYADILSGQMRLNLGTIIQLVPPIRPPARSHLGMVFAAEDVEAAEATITALNDGHSAGFAVSAIDGHGVSGVRVGLIVNEKPDPDGDGELIQEDLKYLRELDVPLGIPLVVDGSQAAASPTFGKIIEGSRQVTPEVVGEDEIVDHGVVTGIDFGSYLDDYEPSPTPDPWATAAAARAELTADSQPQPAQTAAHAAHVMDESDLFGAPRRIVPLEEGF